MNSFLDWINFAFASAKEDSDCAKSDIFIFPLSNLASSFWTCLINNWTFDLLILLFLFADISPVYASTALYKISCSTFKSLTLAAFNPNLFFSKFASLDLPS